MLRLRPRPSHRVGSLPDMTRRWILALALLALPVVEISACNKSSPTSPSPNCSVTISGAPTGNIGPAAMEFNVSVTAAAGCAWSATSNAPFISVGASSGTGNATIKISVQPNTGILRQGTVQIATQMLMVTQEAGTACTFTVSPEQVAVGAGAADVPIDVAVATGTNCAWTATSGSAFVTIKNGASGTGAGRVTLAVAANGGDTRVGTATIAGRTVTLLQDTNLPPVVPCDFSTSPSFTQVPAAGLAAIVITVTKTQGNNCAWIARPTGSWMSIIGQASGIDNGTFTVSIAANTGAARGGSVQLTNNPNVGHADFSQAGGSAQSCQFALTPATLTPTADGGAFGVTITKTQGAAGCSWTAQTQSPFLTVIGNATGVDTGSTTITVDANSGGARSGTLLIAGQTLTVNQAAAGAPGMAAVLSVVSDPGDLVGGGQSNTFTLRGGITVSTDPSHSELQFRILPAGPSGSWFVNMKAPAGQQLGARLFDRAERYPFQEASQPGLSVYNSNGCNQLTGRFLVGEAVYNADLTVQRFHAKFEQHCEGYSVALRGEIWIDAGGSTTVPPMADLPAPPPAPSTFFSFVSSAGDFVGQGLTRNYTLPTMNFLGWRDTDGHVRIAVRPPILPGSEEWFLDFAAPAGSPLLPGTYNGATLYPLQAATVPGLRMFGSGHSCSSATGSFVVLEASYGPQGEVYRFHATFEQYCNGAAQPTRGEIYIVADPWK